MQARARELLTELVRKGEAGELDARVFAALKQGLALRRR